MFLCTLIAMLMVNAAPKRVVKATEEAQGVNIHRVSTFIGTQYDDDEVAHKYIFYGLHQKEEGTPSFYFEFPLADDAHDVEVGKTYFLEDMNAESCEWDTGEEDPETGEIILHHYAKAAFVKTRGQNYDYNIFVGLTDEDGNQFLVSYNDKSVIPTGEEVSIDIARPMEMNYYEYDGSWHLRGYDNTYSVDIRYYNYNSESPDGTFTTEDVLLSDNSINILTEELDEYFDPITKTVYAKDIELTVATNAEGDRIDATATILGDDGVKYHITMFYEKPHVVSTDTINATNLYIDTWALDLWGELEASASNDEGVSIGLNLYPRNSNRYLTTYTFNEDSNNNGYISVDSEQYTIYSGSITLARVEGKYVITGKVLAWNNVEYILNLTEPDPAVTQMTFESESLVLDIYDDSFEISGYDTEHANFLLLDIASTAVAGTYTESDFNNSYTYLENEKGQYGVTSANLTITYANEKATVNGTINMININDQYDLLEVTLTDVVAGSYVPQVYNLNIGNFSITYYDQTESIEYNLFTENEQQVFGLNITTGKWQADVESGRTYTTADLYDDGSYGINKEYHEYIVYTDVAFTKTAVEGVVRIIAKISDTRGNTWNLTYEGEDHAPEWIDVNLGQANLFQHGERAIEYEMLDKDNTFKCVLVIPTTKDDVENDRTYFSENGEIDLVDSYLSILGTEYSLAEASFHKESYGDNVEINATIKDERGYQFRLVFYDDGFIVTGDTIEVHIANPATAMYYAEYGEWMVNAEDDEKAVHFDIVRTQSTESPVGEYDAFDVLAAWSSIEFITGYDDEHLPIYNAIYFRELDYLIISGEEGNYALEALVLAEDGNVYMISAGGAEGIDEVISNQPAGSSRKVIIDGMMYIIRDGKAYNMQGILVK